ncbi:MAG: hypothetical protein ACE5IK_02515, partial [Acidobacteriota bacterium]
MGPPEDDMDMVMKPDRKTWRWLGAFSLALASTLFAAPARAQSTCSDGPASPAPYPCSADLTNIVFDWSTATAAGDGDIWPIAWGPDDALGRDLYTAFGDGRGFSGKWGSSFAFSVVDGAAGGTITGEDISEHTVRREWCLDDNADVDPAGCSSGGGKVDGMVAVDGNFFFVLQQQDKIVANSWSLTLGYSTDGLVTFSQCNKTLFPRGEGFWPLGLVHFGKNYAGGPTYIYVLATGDRNQDNLWIMRIPRPDPSRPQDVCDAKTQGVFQRWEFLSGPDTDGDGVFDGGTPTWSGAQVNRVAIFRDSLHAYTPNVQWVPELGRFILTIFHSTTGATGPADQNGLGVFEATDPWGPWSTIRYFDSWGATAGVTNVDFPLGWNIVPKWTESGGRVLWGAWSGKGVLDVFNVTKATLTVGMTTNEPPATPSIVSVSSITGSSAVLESSAFSDPDPGAIHVASEWQVAVAGGDFSSPVAASGATSIALTSWSVTGLTSGTMYQSRVRHRDNGGTW